MREDGDPWMNSNFFHILYKLLRCTGKLQLLGQSFVLGQLLHQLFLRRIFSEFDKYGCRMAVQDRNTDTRN